MLMIGTSCGITITTTNLQMRTRIGFLYCRYRPSKEILAEQFAKYTNHRPAIYTIPVGSLAKLATKMKIASHSLMITASSLSY